MGVGITLHGREVVSIFDLLGSDENDITKSLGWIFAECDSFREAFVNDILPESGCRPDQVRLQEYEHGAGITDVELRGEDVHIIAEAKRGWCLPDENQLAKYAPRLSRVARHRLLVTLSECSCEFARPRLPQTVGSIAVRHRSWNDLLQLAKVNGSSHAEKRLLGQFRKYLERVVKVQDQTSNWTYVVSVADGTPDWATVSWQDFIEKHNVYFHPASANGWPKMPPNYIAFRYGGQLQSIHHVDGWEIITDMGAKVAGFKAGVKWEKDPHCVYRLGPAIRPPKTVRTGKIFRSGRVWAALDLLLTCDTISEARDLTQQRYPEA